jgi:hypothetical protein
MGERCVQTRNRSTLVKMSSSSTKHSVLVGRSSNTYQVRNWEVICKVVKGGLTGGV